MARLPFAERAGTPLRVRVRQEFNPMAPGVVSIGVRAGAERGQDVQPYPVLDRATATATMRERETDPRVPIPAVDWYLAVRYEGRRVVLTPSNVDLCVKGGF